MSEGVTVETLHPARSLRALPGQTGNNLDLTDSLMPVDTRQKQDDQQENMPATSLCPQSQRITDCLQQLMGPARFERYFGSQPAVRIGASGLEIPVPNLFIARLLDSQFKDMVLR